MGVFSWHPPMTFHEISWDANIFCINTNLPSLDQVTSSAFFSSWWSNSHRSNTHPPNVALCPECVSQFVAGISNCRDTPTLCLAWIDITRELFEETHCSFATTACSLFPMNDRKMWTPLNVQSTDLLNHAETVLTWKERRCRDGVARGKNNFQKKDRNWVSWNRDDKHEMPFFDTLEKPMAAWFWENQNCSQLSKGIVPVPHLVDSLCEIMDWMPSFQTTERTLHHFCFEVLVFFTWVKGKGSENARNQEGFSQISKTFWMSSKGYITVSFFFLGSWNRFLESSLDVGFWWLFVVYVLWGLLGN